MAPWGRRGPRRSRTLRTRLSSSPSSSVGPELLESRSVGRHPIHGHRVAADARPIEASDTADDTVDEEVQGARGGEVRDARPAFRFTPREDRGLEPADVSL